MGEEGEGKKKKGRGRVREVTGEQKWVKRKGRTPKKMMDKIIF